MALFHSKWRLLLLAASVAGLAFWIGQPRTVKVALVGGGEIRVLGTSLGTNHVFSTEPGWKSALRFVCRPVMEKLLGPEPVHRYSTRHEALMVFLGEFDPRRSRKSVDPFGTQGDLRGRCGSRQDAWPTGELIVLRIRRVRANREAGCP